MPPVVIISLFSRNFRIIFKNLLPLRGSVLLLEYTHLLRAHASIINL